MVRWTSQESTAVAELRARLGPLLTNRPQFPEIVGDRKLIRFLRGHDFNIDKVTELYAKSLKWRQEHHIDEIRMRIVTGGYDHPIKFPHAEKIFNMMPHIVIAPHAKDKYNSPICVDQYSFSPSEIMSVITMEEYLEFITYCLEYRQLVLEQLSYHQERSYLSSLSSDERNEIEMSTEKFYGSIITTCVIRDLGGVGLEHFGTQGQNIIRSVISLASENYPEMMKKCYMINTPWLFNTIWYFIKGLIAARTISKIAIIGTSYMAELEENIDADNIPVLVGGKYEGAVSYEPFIFDLDYMVPPPSIYDVVPSSSSSSIDDHKLSSTTSSSTSSGDDVIIGNLSLSGKTTISSSSSSSSSSSVADLISHIILADASDESPSVPTLSTSSSSSSSS